MKPSHAVGLAAVAALAFLYWRGRSTTSPQGGGTRPGQPPGQPPQQGAQQQAGVDWSNPLDVIQRGVSSTLAGFGAAANPGQLLGQNVQAEIHGAQTGASLGQSLGSTVGLGLPGAALGGAAGAVVGGTMDSLQTGTHAALNSFFGRSPW